MTPAARSVFCPACGRHVLRAASLRHLQQTCKGCGAGLRISLTSVGECEVLAVPKASIPTNGTGLANPPQRTVKSR